MLGSIFDHARLTVDASIVHYAGRLAVIIPVAVAFGFATGGTYLVLAEAFGAVEAVTGTWFVKLRFGEGCTKGERVGGSGPPARYRRRAGGPRRDAYPPRVNDFAATSTSR